MSKEKKEESLDFCRDSFKLYGLAENYENLSSKEQIRLVCKYQKTKDEKIKNKIIESNIKYIIKAARAFKGQGLQFGDIVVLGAIGMARAVEKFDKSKKCNFLSYSNWWIEHFIKKALTKNYSLIRVPDVIWQKMHKIKYLKQKGLSGEEIAKKLKINDKQLKMIEMHSETINVISASANEKEDMPEHEYFVNDDTPSDDFELADNLALVKKFVELLPEREKAVIKARFCMDGESRTLQDVANELHLSGERIRQIEKIALDKLRKMMFKGKYNKKR